MQLMCPNRRPRASRDDIADSGGLELVVSVRTVRASQLLRGLPSGTCAVSVFLVNNREPVEEAGRKDEAFAFQAALSVHGDRPFVPRPNPRGEVTKDPDELIADLQYRDVFEFAVGHGIATTADMVGDVCHRVDTTWTPSAEVERVEPARREGVEFGMEALATAAGFSELQGALRGLVSQYIAWITEQRKAAPSSGKQGEVAQELLKQADLAAQRIEAGIELLADDKARDAFQTANAAMAMAARQRRGLEERKPPAEVDPPAWRPFQLAFILMNLRALSDPAHAERELVDLLFFPTGGGKTEAYLGLAAFAIVLRRLRDPGLTSAGVTVLMRYTLRLLTLDQLGRGATLICALELLRQRDVERFGKWPFEIGLWVGKAATPNRMGRRNDKDRTTARARTKAFKADSKKPSPIPIETCPWCGQKFGPNSFALLPNDDEPADLKVVCLNRSCPFRGSNSLPIVAVDEPLYRRLPCFVIATVDKFAGLPWVGASGALLGGATSADSAGFYGPWIPGVGDKLAKSLWPPDLIIQDELHLISGPLGTIAGLYEAAIDALCTRAIDGHTVRPKVVASTATVRRAETQIRALFARSGVAVFPPPGPDRRDSFFARTVPSAEKAGRAYLGISAQGRSLKVILLRAYLALLAAAQKAWAEDGGTKNPKNLADAYMTLVGYFNSLRELGGSRRIVEDEVASRVADYARRKRVGESSGSFADRSIARDARELTSRESTASVADTKRRLALAFTEKDRVDVALATNMISVGLDITRLGLMVVLGQPKTTSEYIQATSRVGRDGEKPGLVVTLLNIHRPRDRSHYERFEAYHRSFYRAVEATSVTPFAPRALDRALPGVTVALARHTRAMLTPAKGAQSIVEERAALGTVAETLVARAKAHRLMNQDDLDRIVQRLRARTGDLLDAWVKVAKAKRDVGARLVYQRYEDVEGPPLLRMPLDPELEQVSQDERKFKAARSMRDVEPSVNLWVKRLDGVVIESPAEDEA